MLLGQTYFRTIGDGMVGQVHPWVEILVARIVLQLEWERECHTFNSHCGDGKINCNSLRFLTTLAAMPVQSTVLAPIFGIFVSPQRRATLK